MNEIPPATPPTEPTLLDAKQLAARLAADRDRMFLALGIDPTDPATAAILEEVENDGLPDHWSQVQFPPVDPDHPLIKLEAAYRARLEGKDPEP